MIWKDIKTVDWAAIIALAIAVFLITASFYAARSLFI
jgi:hypothetical protein